ncbi:hypothetical protein CEXT_622981 [Caerostris extrusa]|uniref:Uncharacterized protein n=1 Tax=Caerostris extrusa TaxID=172846 RepID=A0AAV4XSJ8_CAEEX|nr:hypothetical protein CEXT_622981 [Caerostris extrusa]
MVLKTRFSLIRYGCLKLGEGFAYSSVKDGFPKTIAAYVYDHPNAYSTAYRVAYFTGPYIPKSKMPFATLAELHFEHPTTPKIAAVAISDLIKCQGKSQAPISLHHHNPNPQIYMHTRTGESYRPPYLV